MGSLGNNIKDTAQSGLETVSKAFDNGLNSLGDVGDQMKNIQDQATSTTVSYFN